MSSSSQITTRTEERQELQHLNGRLESVVAHSRAYRQVAEDAASRTESVQRQFESRTAALEASHKNQIESLEQRVKAELESTVAARQRIAELESSLASAQASASRVPGLTTEVSVLQGRLKSSETEAAAQRERADKLDAALKTDRTALAECQRKLKEAELKLSVAVGESKASREEVLALRDQRKKDVDDYKKKDDPNRIAGLLREAEAQVEKLHLQKMKELEASLKREHESEVKGLQTKVKSLQEANERLRSDFTTTSAELASATDFGNGLLKRIASIEDSHKRDFASWATEKTRLEASLASEIDRSLKRDEQFSRLQGVNITLQTEIDHYARLLAAEEAEAGVTLPPGSAKKARHAVIGAGASSSGSVFDGPDTGAGTGLLPLSDLRAKAAKGAGKGKKRGRDEAGLEVTSASGRKAGSGHAAVEEGADFDAELDLRATMVPIANATDEPVNLAGWKLVAGSTGASFEFPELVLGPGTSVTVWSGPDAPGQVSIGPDGQPSGILWSTAYQFTEEGDTASLYDPKGSLVAKVTAERGAKYGPSDISVSVDLEAEEVALTNSTRQDIALAGWYVASNTGNQKFVFPKAAVLPSGGTVKIFSGREADSKASSYGPLGYLWTRRFIWNDNGDSASLFDRKNRCVSTVEGRHHADIAADAKKGGNCIVM